MTEAEGLEEIRAKLEGGSLSRHEAADLIRADRQWSKDRIVELEAEVERLRGRILQWAADRCDDPLDHSQEHTPLGVPAGYCGKCGMRYPCPSILAALEANP